MYHRSVNCNLFHVNEKICTGKSIFSIENTVFFKFYILSNIVFKIKIRILIDIDYILLLLIIAFTYITDVYIFLLYIIQ